MKINSPTIAFGKSGAAYSTKPYSNTYLQVQSGALHLLHTPVGDDYMGPDVTANGEKFKLMDTLLGKVLGFGLDDKTRKVELADGKGASQVVSFDPDKATHNATLASKRICAQPLLRIIKKGTAKGKVVIFEDDAKLKRFMRLGTLAEPIMAVVDSPLYKTSSYYNVAYSGHPLVKGVIFANRDENLLSHDLNHIRTTVEIGAMAYDKKIINALKKLKRKFIELNISRDGMDFREISPDEIENRVREKQKIEIRPMSSEARILKPDEINLDNAGPKAVNLKRMLDMQKAGKLQNVKIPPFFVIPVGIFESFLDANPELAKDFREHVKKFEGNLPFDEAVLASYSVTTYLQRMLFREEVEQEPPEAQAHYQLIAKQIDEHIKEIIDTPKDYLITRSAFNGEDTPNYSAAGLYESQEGSKPNSRRILLDMLLVWNSQYGTTAYLSRKVNGIEESAIKPCAIVQKQILPDYSFTVYTDDIVDPDSLFIELGSTYDRFDGYSLTSDPNIIKYNKKTGKLSLIAKERFNNPVVTDLKGNVVIASEQKSEIADNFEKWEGTLKGLAESCLELAEEFGAPQDIEGGIKIELQEDGKEKHQIYLWQTRNIV